MLNTKTSLSHIFNETDVIFLSDGFLNGKYINYETCAVKDLSKTYQYYSINPLINPIDLRRNSNVAKYQNFLFESDKQTLEEQKECMHRAIDMGLVSLATFSGNKSIHLISSLSVPMSNITAGTTQAATSYARAWEYLADKYKSCGLIPDQATKDPCRLSRTPGAKPLDKVAQNVLHIGPLLSENFVSTIPVPPTVQYQATPINDLSLKEFELKLSTNQKTTALYMTLKYPQSWAYHSGMYDKLFKYALWAIDATGVPYEILITFLRVNTFPVIVKSGYTRDLERPIKDAYRKKE